MPWKKRSLDCLSLSDLDKQKEKKSIMGLLVLVLGETYSSVRAASGLDGANAAFGESFVFDQKLAAVKSASQPVFGVYLASIAHQSSAVKISLVTAAYRVKEENQKSQ